METHWVKCSKRLPNADGTYFVVMREDILDRTNSVCGIVRKRDALTFSTNLANVFIEDVFHEYESEHPSHEPGWYKRDIDDILYSFQCYTKLSKDLCVEYWLDGVPDY